MSDTKPQRVAFKMRVHPEKHAEYAERHNPIWPELEQTLREHGVHSYSIFMDEDTHTLFGYAEIESEERWKAIADTGVCQRWWLSMKDLMPSNPDNSPISSSLKEVFHIGGSHVHQ